MASSGRQPVSDGGADLNGLAPGNGRTAHPLPQRLALQQFRDHIRRLTFGPDIVDGQDVWMRERGDSLGLALKTPQSS